VTNSSALGEEGLRALRARAQLLHQVKPGVSPDEIVWRVCGVQAQELPSATLALRAHAVALTSNDVDEARVVVGGFQAPRDDLVRDDADHRPAAPGVGILREPEGLGSALHHNRAWPPGGQDVVDDKRRLRVLSHVAELLGGGEVPPRDVDGAQLGIVPPPDRYHVRLAGRVDGRQPAQTPLAQQVVEFSGGE
jgi:hypothetical protein